jgi:putative intracellular protease/amidase
MRLISLTLLLALFTVTAFAAEPAHPRTVYVCPMADHTQEFDKPGSCPICGMQLVEKEGRFRVAVLVFNYAEDIDFTAPIEVLGQSGAQVFTVAATAEPITTVFGLHVRPDYDLAHAPASDVILVPGGGVGDTAKDERVISWVRQRAAQSRYVMSVCNGAFILAKAGLLDGLTATTTAGRIDELTMVAPKTHVVRERVVDNGKVITTAGLSAGIDGALHVIEREYGRTRAEHIARQIEYRWQPESKWTRSALADMRMPDVKLPSDAKWEELVSHGDTQQWETSGRLHVAMTADEFIAYATKQITANGWTLRDSSGGKRTFLRTDGGQTWVTTLQLRRDETAAALDATMTVHAVK